LRVANPSITAVLLYNLLLYLTRDSMLLTYMRIEILYRCRMLLAKNNVVFAQIAYRVLDRFGRYGWVVRAAGGRCSSCRLTRLRGGRVRDPQELHIHSGLK
jgi:hypothetical protein